MAIALTSFNANTKAQSAQVNTNFSNVSQGVTDTSYRAFTWGIPGGLSAGNAQGMQYIVPENVTAIKIWGKTTSGTAVIRLNKDTTEITDATNHFALTSTVGSTVTFNANTILAGQVLTLDVVSTSSGVDCFVTIETQVSTIV